MSKEHPHSRENSTSDIDNGMMPPSRKNKRPPKFEHKDRFPKPERTRQAEHPRKQGTSAKETLSNDSKPRLTRNPRELVVETLMKLENGGFSNIVWDNAIKHSDLSNLDKMLATRIFYGTLSNLKLLDAFWNDIEPEMLKRADSVVKMTLRCAMYQLVFLDRVPAYSIVSTSVDIAKRLRNRAAGGYCNALLRKAVARQEAGELKFKPTGNRVVDFSTQYSLNDDIAQVLLNEFGDDADKIAESMLSIPKMVLRVNTSKTTLDKLMSAEGFAAEKSRLMPETSCVVLNRHESIDLAIERGEACVQDEAAQLAVWALGKPETWNPSQDEIHIWDACAGQGGKSIHLLDQIAIDTSGRKFTLLSTDIYANKLERLREYRQKFFTETHLITKARDLTVPGSVPLAPFDAILVDAPCSGLGVLRRHPEVKLNRTSQDIDALVALQRDILNNVCRHLKVGGILVYAVCTITLEECEYQVQNFLETHPNFKADLLPLSCLREPASQVKFLPHIDGCDGFFVARFVRKQ